MQGLLSGIFLLAIAHLSSSKQITLPLSSEPRSYSDNDDNEAYYTSLSLGSPPQSFRVFISTWTTVIFNQSTTVPKIGSSCDASKYFNPSLSSSFIPLNITGAIEFRDDNDIDGQYCSETLTIGDDSPVTTQNFKFLLASYCNCSDFQSGGVLGLGFSDSEISGSRIVTWLKSQKVIEKAIFSLYLSNVGFRDEKSQKKKSSIIFGGHDKDKYAQHSGDSFHYHDVEKDSQHWYLELSEVRFSSYNFLQNFDAIIDPGSKYLYGPNAVVERIKELIRNRHLCYTDDGEYKCHCNDYENFRDITFVMDGIDYDLSAKWFVEKHHEICTIHIYGTHQNRWILGQIFLRKYYSLWDYEEERIGFMKSVNNDDSDDNSAEAWVVIVVVVCTVSVVLASFVILLIIYKKKKVYRESVKSGQYDALRVN